MVTTLVRFNQVQPGLEPSAMADRYQASLDMAAYADTHGFALVTLEEHHGADDGWSPSPLVSAGLVFGRCPRIHVVIMALLLPLHDPVRLAEDIAVLDLASGGRLSIVGGLGYRPQEYELLGKSWADRGRLMDEAVDTLLKAWTGEPFEYRGTTVRVTPIPFTRPLHRGNIETVGPTGGPVRTSAGDGRLPPRAGGLLLRAVPGGRHRGFLLHASGQILDHVRC
jgi:alkanesulfonate monooxygenase SsuD/methylene tetrahydromethanopterin reductase-like flavin-dependent oxidoreductase (luciferase family)